MNKGYLYDEGDELITRKEDAGLPDTSEASSGDVLSLDSEKKPVWSAPSGGGGGGKISILFDQPTITVGNNTLYPTDKTWQEAVDNCYAVDLEQSICSPTLYSEEDETVEGYPYGYTVKLAPSGNTTLVASSASGTLYFVMSGGD